ncbi:MAG: ATP-binding cassette domain-containing protein [bacterium]|nr:ATP-binding cassette domain-containing protein [bacterium]
MQPIFDLKGFNLDFGEHQVLKGINLKIERGEKVALIGPSGAGKTTLLKELFAQAAEPKAFVPQAQAMVAQLSLFHNVYIGALDHHSFFVNLLNLLVPQAKMKQKILPILRNLGIEQRIFESIGSFSGGEQQRAAIARGLFRPADLLLADEPVSSLDPVKAGSAIDLMLREKETVILSLHSVDLALSKAQRIIGLKAGQILFDRPQGAVTPADLKQLYQP